MVYFWIALLVVFVIVETITVQLVTVWFALGSLAAVIANLLGANELVQWIVFLLVSVISLLVTRPFAKKLMKRKIEPTNADRYIGATGVVTQDINNEIGEGQVNLSGSIWTARSVDGTKITRDEPIVVSSIEGVKVMVSKK